MRVICKVVSMTACTVTAGYEALLVCAISGHEAAIVTVVTGCTAVVGVGRGTDQGIIMAVAATRRINPDQEAVVRHIGRMSHFPGIRMTGGAVAAGGEVLTKRRADEGAGVGVMAAGTAVMSLGGGADQRVVVTIGTARRWNLHQRGVAGRVGEMNHFPRNTGVWTMAGHTVATTGRNISLQGRDGRVTEGTISVMGHINRRVGGRTRIVTVETEGRPAGHIAGADRHVVNAAVDGQVLVQMAVQAMGRVGSRGDSGNHFRPRTVMTGGAGTGTVGGNIVLSSFDLGPVRHDVADAAELARIVGEVSGADFYRMSEIAMAGSLVGVAIQARNLGAVQPLTNGGQNN